MVNSMLSYSGLSEGFWEEAMLTGCYLLNRVPNKSNKTTPYEHWDDHSDDVPSEIPEPRKEEDPRTYDEAMQSWDAAFWKEAIDDEIGCKWIFKRQMKVDGTIDKFKARLVIQGFRQKEGIDYFDTYAPVACITIIRLLLALAAIHNLVINQMDVKTTFLNGDLDEEVFSMKDMGEADVILGIKIKRGNKGIVITQSHYIEKILKKFYREDYSPMSTLCFTPRRRIGFRMELVQGATPICEGSCRLTSLERQEVWNDCKSCKVRVGSNGNLLWEASVLLGRKKGGVHGDDIAKTVFRMRNGHVEVYGYAFWVNQCTSDFHGVNEPGGVRVAREDDRRVTEGREDVREVFQQRGSGAKRKLSRCRRNQMGNEPILALSEGEDDFVVYYDARSKDLKACLEKG
ncbi:zinc finger, CCHC-type containing protein [Tanacetum coccineum]|uniref:Zinc finger, CCHC-type containing protein n=1 Tax=Tanacetum coccineum TaxID=301880 RepID=A0ABQ5FAV3_9ASTR